MKNHPDCFSSALTVLQRLLSGDTFGLSRIGITLSKYENSHLKKSLCCYILVLIVCFGFLFVFSQNHHTGGSLFLQTEVWSIVAEVTNITK